ncbi:hypothetical protein ACFL9U_17185 [Thermodesulfobacteriota bacterium]
MKTTAGTSGSACCTRLSHGVWLRRTYEDLIPAEPAKKQAAM